MKSRTTHKVCSESPIVGEDVGEGEGHGEGAEENVGDSQVCNEDVPGGQHRLRIEFLSQKVNISSKTRNIRYLYRNISSQKRMISS